MLPQQTNNTFIMLFLLDFTRFPGFSELIISAYFGLFWRAFFIKLCKNLCKTHPQNQFYTSPFFWHLDGVNGRIIRKIYRLRRAFFLYLSHLPTLLLKLSLLSISTRNLLCCFLCLSKLLHLFLSIIQFKVGVSVKCY